MSDLTKFGIEMDEQLENRLLRERLLELVVKNTGTPDNKYIEKTEHLFQYVINGKSVS